MTTKAAIEELLSQHTLAVVGVSRSDKKFGNHLFHALRKKGYQVFPINPVMDEIDGEPCYPSLSALPEPVGGAVLVVPPAVTEKVVQDALRAGIKRIWMQQGSESPAAIQLCQSQEMTLVHGECIFMFLPQIEFFHKFHRWIKTILGRMPR